MCFFSSLSGSAVGSCIKLYATVDMTGSSFPCQAGYSLGEHEVVSCSEEAGRTKWLLPRSAVQVQLTNEDLEGILLTYSRI